MILESVPEPVNSEEHSNELDGSTIFNSDDDDVYLEAEDNDIYSGYQSLNSSEISDLDYIDDSEDNEEENAPSSSLSHSSSHNNFIESSSTSASRSDNVDLLSDIVENDSCKLNSRDIPVNCDQVRSAMAGFELPASAIPPWAQNISETELDRKIIDHVSSLSCKIISEKVPAYSHSVWTRFTILDNEYKIVTDVNKFGTGKYDYTSMKMSLKSFYF